MTCFYWDGQPPKIDNLSIFLNGYSPDLNILASGNAQLKFAYDDTDG
jgi:hypothetical protein